MNEEKVAKQNRLEMFGGCLRDYYRAAETLPSGHVKRREIRS